MALSLMGAANNTEETSIDQINETVDVDEKDIVLEFDLDYKDEFAATVSAKDFKLDYGFNTMTVKSIEWKDDMAFKVTLDGKIDKNYETAQVRILSSAFTDGRESVDITFDIVKPQMFIEYSDISFEDGVLKMPITLYQCKFEQKVDITNVSFTGDVPAEITAFKKIDDTNAVISMTVENYDDIDAVLKAFNKVGLDGAEIAVSGEALTTINGTAVDLTMPFAGVVPQIEETVPNEDGTLQVLCRLYGYNKTIDTSLITLGGNFAYSADTAAFTISEDGETLMSFTVDPTKAEDLLLRGKLTLAAGALTNPWGTASEELSYERSISFEEPISYSKETEAVSLEFIPFGEIGTYSYMPYTVITDEMYTPTSLASFFSSLSPISDSLEIVNSAIAFGTKIAQWAGWIEADDAPEMKILAEIKALQTQNTNLGLMIQNLSDEVGKQGAKTRIQNFETRLADLSAVTKEYTAEIDKEVRKLLRTGSADVILSGADYNSLSEKDKQTAKTNLETTIKNYSQTQSKAQIMASLGGNNSFAAKMLFAKAGETVGKSFYKYPVNGTTLNASFISLCNTVTTPGTTNVLADFDEIINNTYNWEYEAFPFRDKFREMIISRLYESYSVLTKCIAADPDLTDASNVSTAYTNLYNYFRTGAGVSKDRNPANPSSNKGFCITANKVLTFVKSTDYWGANSPTFYRSDKFLHIDVAKQMKLRAVKLGRSIAADMKVNKILPREMKVLACAPYTYTEYTFSVYCHTKSIDAYDKTTSLAVSDYEISRRVYHLFQGDISTDTPNFYFRID
jgi:hypothetical protein